MNDCLVTKLQGTFDNSALKELGHVRIEVIPVDEPSDSNRKIVLQAPNGFTVTVIGNGYVSDTYPATTTTSYTHNSSSKKTLYLSNGSYYIDINKKLNRISDINYGVYGQPLYVNLAELYSCDLVELCLDKAFGDIFNLSDSPNIGKLSLNNCNRVYGDLSVLPTKKLTMLNILGTHIHVSLSDLGRVIIADASALTLFMRDSVTGKYVNVTGTIEEFVGSCITNGYTTGGINARGLLNGVTTFGSQVLPAMPYSSIYWDSSSKMRVQGGPYLSSKIMYCRGYSSSEIAEFEGDGWTVTDVTPSP